MVDLMETIGAIVETVLIAAHADVVAPLGGLTAGAIISYWTRRYDAARDILRSELERCAARPEDFRNAEETAAAAIRYARAVRDQAADENLRILTNAMVGLARRDELWGSDFLKYADILAPLSKDELVVIGTLMELDARWVVPNAAAGGPKSVGGVLRENAAAYGFADAMEIESVAARAQRSGLLQPISGFGGTTYELSRLGRKVRGFVDVQLMTGRV